MTEPITLRPVLDTEQAQALALWYAVFHETPGFFERYYSDADPGYQQGDTLGAWSGERLVSAVHLCRRPAVWEGERLLCGGIANVATLPPFRRRGLSRRLLEMAVARMEAEGFHFSLLGTGVPGHYAALGWEQTHAPRFAIRLGETVPAIGANWKPLDTTGNLSTPYAASPRPGQFVRDPAYFEGWVGWNWRRSPQSICRLPGRGYLVLDVPDDPGAGAGVAEWRAADAETERQLLQAAAAETRRRGYTHLGLNALPQHVGQSVLHSLGKVSVREDEGGMVRNVGLPGDSYQRLRAAYHTGQAVWWPGDAF